MRTRKLRHLNVQVAVYDNGGATLDRYTVIPLDADWHGMALGLSTQPSHPQGFSQWGQCSEGPHLGKRIRFEQLPRNVQEHVMMRLGEDE